MHHREQLDGRTEPAILYVVGAPGMSEMKTKQVINTYGLQHFKQYVYRGVEQKKNVLEPWHTVTRVALDEPDRNNNGIICSTRNADQRTD